MENQTTEVQETTTVESETTQNTTEENRAAELNAEATKKLTELEDQNKKLFERAKKAEADAKAAKALAETFKTASTKTLDVEDYIDISASLEGLDQKEKERLAREHKLTGKPLSEIRKDEDFLLWQTAYKQKVEKEKLALKPSGTQSIENQPQTLADRLKNASLADKEKILAEAGLYKTPRPRADRVNIGPR